MSTGGPAADGRSRLGRELRALRLAVPASGTTLARMAGWSQSRVSKIETGRKLCSEQELETWLATTRASASDAGRIRGLYGEVRAGADDPDPARGVPEDDRSTRCVHPLLLPAIVMTGDYLTSLVRSLPGLHLTGDRLDRMQQDRIRQQEALYRDGSRVHLLVGQQALDVDVVPPGTRSAQLERLLELAELPAVTIGVVPAERTPLTAVPAAFTIRSPPARVSLGGLAGDHCLGDPDQVAVYEAAWRTVLAAAEDPAGSVELIRRSRT